MERMKAMHACVRPERSSRILTPGSHHLHLAEHWHWPVWPSVEWTLVWKISLTFKINKWIFSKETFPNYLNKWDHKPICKSQGEKRKAMSQENLMGSLCFKKTLMIQSPVSWEQHTSSTGRIHQHIHNSMDNEYFSGKKESTGASHTSKNCLRHKQNLNSGKPEAARRRGRGRWNHASKNQSIL